MRALGVCAFVALVGACTPAVTEIALSEVDLADGKTLASLQEALPPDDRAALGTYALLHWPKSKFYCGKPIGGQVKEARTVGEAIAITRAYEIALAEKVQAEKMAAGNLKQIKERELVTRMEQLVLERDMLRSSGSTDPGTSRREREIKDELAQFRTELAALRSAPAV